jgi:hypothetical protein
MAPTLLPGDVVGLSGSSAGIGPGDAVVFRGKGDYDVVHRFVFKVPLMPYFVHRGDAPEALVGVAHVSCLVGTAALPRRTPSLREHAAGWQLLARLAARSVRRRLRS